MDTEATGRQPKGLSRQKMQLAILEAKYEADKKRIKEQSKTVSDEESMPCWSGSIPRRSNCTANITANTAKETPRQKALAITARRNMAIYVPVHIVIMSRKTQYYNEKR